LTVILPDTHNCYFQKVGIRRGQAHELAGDTSDDDEGADSLIFDDSVKNDIDNKDVDDDDDEFDFAPPAPQSPSEPTSTEVVLEAPTSRWARHPVEIAVLMGMLLVSVHCYLGIGANRSIARQWLHVALPFFESQFHKVGFDGCYIQSQGWSDFEFFASGRENCQSCTIAISLLPRQCVWARSIFSTFLGSEDSIVMEIPLDTMQLGMMAVCKRKELKKLQSYSPILKEASMLRKCGANMSSAGLCVLADNSDVVDELLTPQWQALLSSKASVVKHIIVGDKLMTERSGKEIAAIHAYLKLPSDPEELKATCEILQLLVGTMIDHATSSRATEKTSKELKKNRATLDKQQRLEKEAEREEQLDVKRSKKKQMEEEKLDQMTPAQQKKWEEKQYKKSLKNKGPKFKNVGS